MYWTQRIMDFKLFKNKIIGIAGLGYIGKNLYEYLKKNTVIYNTEIIIFNRENINKIKEYQFDYFFNTAGNSGDFRSDILGTIKSNISLSTFLLENVKINKKYISLSSVRIYGFSENDTVLFDEESISSDKHTNINFIYDGTKKLVESILINYSEKVNFDISIVRLSNVYGNFFKLNDSTLIKKIISYKTKSKELTINESLLNTKKDYIYIDDALEGITMTALFGKNKEVYNIASGKSFSIADIANIINFNLKTIKDNKKEVFSNISIKKAALEINFMPQTNIINGLLQTINSYNK